MTYIVLKAPLNSNQPTSFVAIERYHYSSPRKPTMRPNNSKFQKRPSVCFVRSKTIFDS